MSAFLQFAHKILFLVTRWSNKFDASSIDERTTTLIILRMQEIESLDQLRRSVSENAPLQNRFCETAREGRAGIQRNGQWHESRSVRENNQCDER